ncbi:PREDICTED: vomeronasal type-1 receptor 4-like [Condylura cristata]|uniref:vomeronasal type-1 receptor 4-like n=1 Tax=Condylura cristata TaxID=143302 RepID=UPI0003347050|nr:PREDICTED: vomeronasal type-1 receptor 4-like [Condylura cristata]
MEPRDLVVGTVILLQSVLGIVGNFSLLSHQIFLNLTASRLRLTDLVIRNLIVANFMLLFSRGIGYVVTYFGWCEESDFGCKFQFYIGGVGRGVSISTTCLLSVVQASTVSPRGSTWAGLRDKAPRYTCPSLALCWVLSLLANVLYPMFMSSIHSHKNDTSRKIFGECSSVRHDTARDFLHGALLSFPDVVFFVTMAWASGSLVCTLYRHRQRVRHLHSSRAAPASSPESRATRTILLLVSTFICLNSISSIMNTALSVIYNPDLFLLNFNTVIILCFPTLCPFLLLSREPKRSQLCSACTAKSPALCKHVHRVQVRGCLVAS